MCGSSRPETGPVTNSGNRSSKAGPPFPGSSRTTRGDSRIRLRRGSPSAAEKAAPKTPGNDDDARKKRNPRHKEGGTVRGVSRAARNGHAKTGAGLTALPSRNVSLGQGDKTTTRRQSAAPLCRAAPPKSPDSGVLAGLSPLPRHFCCPQRLSESARCARACPSPRRTAPQSAAFRSCAWGQRRPCRPERGRWS